MQSQGQSHHPLVDVTVTVTDQNGSSQTDSKSIMGGPTRVTDLKGELGVPPESALWVIGKSEKKKQLGDHETHNVKKGDLYEAIVRGGVS